jgi:ankyrin repeat protein
MSIQRITEAWERLHLYKSPKVILKCLAESTVTKVINTGIDHVLYPIAMRKNVQKVHRDLLILSIFLHYYYGDQEYIFIDRKAVKFIMNIIFNSVYSEHICTNTLFKKYIGKIVIEKSGNTLLSYCLEKDKILYAKKLVFTVGLDDSYFNIKNKKNITAFMLAISLNKIEIVKYFLRKKIDFNLTFKESNCNGDFTISLLNFLVDKNFSEMIELLVKHQHQLNLKKIVNLKDSIGQSALTMACLKNHTECIKSLLKIKKVDVNQTFVYEEEWYSIFLYMCSNNNIEIVKLLLKKKFKTDFNIELYDHGYFNGFALSCKYYFYELIKVLLQHRKINNSDVLSYCIFNILGKKELVNLFLEHPNFDINNARMKSHPYDSLLIYCAECNYIDMVAKFLSDPKISVDCINYVNGHGNTALKIAARKGNLEIVKLLLQFPGINVSYIKTFDRSSALSDVKYNLSRAYGEYYERRNNFIEIIKLLEEQLLKI